MLVYVYESEFEVENGMLYSVRPPSKRFWKAWGANKDGMKAVGWHVKKSVDGWEASIQVQHLRCLKNLGNEIYVWNAKDTSTDRRLKADGLVTSVEWTGLTDEGTVPINLSMEVMEEPLKSFGFRFDVDEGVLYLPETWTVGVDALWGDPMPSHPYSRRRRAN